MASEPTLLKMPDDVMIEIMNRCDLESVLILRKTCHDIRSFIDGNQFEAQIKRIKTKITEESAHLILDDEEIIYFRDDGFGCQILRNDGLKNYKKVKKQNYLDVFFKDFEIIWGFCKSQVLGSIKFYICESVDPEKLYSILADSSIKTHLVSIKCKNQVIITKFLPLISPETLKVIKIEFWDKQELSPEFVNSEQWKRAKEVKFWNFKLAEMEHFMHFEYATLIGMDFTLQDVEAVDRKMTQSSTLKTIILMVYLDEDISTKHRSRIVLENGGNNCYWHTPE